MSGDAMRMTRRRCQNHRLSAWAKGIIISVTLLLTACRPHFVDAGAFAHVWEDANCNGQPEEGEAPLQGVCVWFGDHADSPIPHSEYCDNEWGQTDVGGSGTVVCSGIVAVQMSTFLFELPTGFSQRQTWW
jgi:hypothetical protein